MTLTESTPLDILEADARRLWPDMAQVGSLHVLYQAPGGFSYQWGGSCVSRECAVRKLDGRI